MADFSTSPNPSSAPAAPPAEPEIHTIPERYYGAALHAVVPDPGTAKSSAPEGEGPSRSHTGLIVGISVVFLLLAAAGVAYWQRDAIRRALAPPAPVVVETPPVSEPANIPPPVAVPEAPTAISATSTGSSGVSVSWTDTAANESGFRLERAEAEGAFVALTSLPPNATSFLDTSVQPERTYRYRVLAVNTSGDSAASSEASATTAPLPPPVPAAPTLPPAGLDTDSDGLTDLEEELLKSNPRDPDTDADGFLDGNEAFHLYNPNGRAPARLVDAGLLKPFSSGAGWSILLPNPWNVALDAQDGSKATITTGHGELLRIAIEANPQRQPILAWYKASHPEATDAQILKYRSKRGYEGIIGADQLTTYLPWGDKVFVLTYDFGGQPFKNFSTALAMVLNSLELGGMSSVSAPTSAPLPFEPASSTPGVIAQPETVSGVPSQP